jgi:hypothetical protein
VRFKQSEGRTVAAGKKATAKKSPAKSPPDTGPSTPVPQVSSSWPYDEVAKPWTRNPTKSLVRGALLSARLYADAQADPLVPYGGWGTMPILDAVQILIEDGIRRENADTRWPTRLRVATALGQAAEKKLHESPLPDDAPTAKRLRDLAQQLASTAPDQPRAQAFFEQTIQVDPPAPADRVRLDTAANWHVDVMSVGSATRIVATVDVLSDYKTLVDLLNPERWHENSIFWFKSEALEPKRYSDGSWKGVLREVVAGIAIFTVDLGIDYRKNAREQQVRYWLITSPDPIRKDEGYITIASSGLSGVQRVTIEKLVDFADNPYGGPSALDLLAPSYMASWMRVQQDQWAATLATILAEAQPAQATSA